ncbi:MAG: hypothetical protein ABIJ21_06695 [Nanoarchaeota archaeon]
MKKGVELAVNFLVIFILMLVTLGIGLALFFKIKASTEKINQDVSDEIRKQIEQEMIDSGSRIVIPFTLQKIKRDKSGYFFIGIENVNDEEHTFKILVTPVTEENDMPRYIAADDVFKIDPHERAYRKVWFFVPKASKQKQFIYDVRICYNIEGEDNNECQTDSAATPAAYPPLNKVYVTPK